jgi:hypothetical protein
MLYIIIGLPASGKTTYYHNELNELSHLKFYDDFITTFFDNELIEDLEAGIDLCITDPRLCDINRFRDYMKLFNNYVKKEDIKLIIFKNNPENCLLNAGKRNKKRVEKTIEMYSKIYNPELYKDDGYTIVKIIDVLCN